MTKGPRGEKRPGDVVGAAVKSMRILTGEDTEDVSSAKRVSARKGGKAGGKARAATLSPEQREEIAKAAADARWKKRK